MLKILFILLLFCNCVVAQVKVDTIVTDQPPYYLVEFSQYHADSIQKISIKEAKAFLNKQLVRELNLYDSLVDVIKSYMELLDDSNRRIDYLTKHIQEIESRWKIFERGKLDTFNIEIPK